MAATQIEIPGIPAPEPKELAITPMSLMQMALETGKAEQLQILQEMYFKDKERKAEEEFNLAMNAVQAEIGRVKPNLLNPQTKSRYASYDKLDAELRPIYTRHGFSLSFSEEDSSKPNHVRVICYVSRGGHTRVYRKDMPVVTTGIKGNEMMTLTDATSSADSYGKRYLVKDIFNVAIGEDDDDGNGGQQNQGGRMNEQEAQERYAYFDKCNTFEELENHWRASRAAAIEANDEDAKNAFDSAKNRRKEQLRKAGAR